MSTDSTIPSLPSTANKKNTTTGQQIYIRFQCLQLYFDQHMGFTFSNNNGNMYNVSIVTTIVSMQLYTQLSLITILTYNVTLSCYNCTYTVHRGLIHLSQFSWLQSETTTLVLESIIVKVDIGIQSVIYINAKAYYKSVCNIYLVLHHNQSEEQEGMYVISVTISSL